jgi:8-oxo-dGTP pyrophosphatase MutT (NUDIX family)
MYGYQVNTYFVREVTDLNMQQKQIIILLCSGVVCLLLGFIINAASPDNVPIGIVFYVAAIVIITLSLIPAIKLAVNKKRKNLFTATGLVFNDIGQILMVKNRKQNKWVPPGGHIDENELPCAAVVREVFEETGIKVQVLSSAPKRDLSSGTSTELPLPLKIAHVDVLGTGLLNYVDFLYLCRTKTTETTPQEAEIDEIGWFSPEKAMSLDTHEDIVKAIDYGAKIMQELSNE